MTPRLRLLRTYWRLLLVAVVSLGIGLATVILGFGAFNALLLRPPGVRAPAELLTIFSPTAAGPYGMFSDREFRYVRDRSQAFSGVAAFPHQISGVAFSDGTRHETAFASYASDNFFEVLGV